MMKIIASSLSVLFGIIASVLVFTPYFKTPPMPILIFAILGMIVGFYRFPAEDSLFNRVKGKAQR